MLAGMGASGVIALVLFGGALSLWGFWPIWGRPLLPGAAHDESRRRPMVGVEKLRITIGVLVLVGTALFALAVLGFMFGWG
jgi:hypothetical protein